MLKLSGRSTLEDLLITGKYVFHGSQDGELTRLKPIKGDSKRYNTVSGEVNEAEKYVYATEHLDLAIFVAAIWRRVGASGWTTSGISESRVEFEFHASPEAIAEASKVENIGYVYVLDRQQFEHDKQNPYEIVSSLSVEPYAIVKVTAHDLKPSFKTLSAPPHAG
jgi:hypothetical protein